MSESCDKLPSSLFIKGVRDPDAQASFGGGFGDVYRASYDGSVVALKRMRVFQRDEGMTRMRRVSGFHALCTYSLMQASEILS